MEPSIAYIAGLFDGEGSIGLYHNGKAFNGVRCQLVQNDNPISRKLWLQLQASYGGGMSFRPSTNGRPKMNWSLSGHKAIDFIREIDPYLILKRPQSELLLSWWDARPPLVRGKNGILVPRGVDAIAESERVSILLKELKRIDSIEGSG